MRSAATAARRSPAARNSEFSNLCWGCLIKQRRQLSHASSSTKPAATATQEHGSGRPPAPKRTIRYQFVDKPPKRTHEQPPSENERTKTMPIEEYHKHEQRLLDQLVRQHRRQAKEQEAAVAQIAAGKDDRAGARSASFSGVGHLADQAPGTKRSFHSARSLRQETIRAAKREFLQDVALAIPEKPRNVTTREYLQQWQEQNGRPNKEILDELGIEAYADSLSENMSRISSPDDLRTTCEVYDAEEAANTAAFRDQEDLLDEEVSGKFLRPGDLVELRFASEREPMIAVFVQQFSEQAQFYSINGKWFHRKVRTIHFCVPGYLDPRLLEAIKPFLPKGEVTNDLVDQMQILDINAPRELAAPIIRKLKDFVQEADAVYRRHASTLDRAHSNLAHETDLRFGTLQKITEMLLRIRDPSVPTMYAVRKALLRQPLGFQVDNRSHRETSVFQILPIEFVRRAEMAVTWIREYQDGVATLVAASGRAEGDQKPSKTSHGYKIVSQFISKAKKLIDQSRTMRDFTPHGRVGISLARQEITPDSEALTEFTSLEFTEAESTLIRFMESWSLNGFLKEAPRINSLPPILLRATGRYRDCTLDHSTGSTFLQEIGIVPPHENRTKFDPHLLLPTAQHSRSLEMMYNALVKMGVDREQVATQDSMADLRKDWKNASVFCVDSATAEEIDDGVSLERIPGVPEYWVHVHVANPTAFLGKTHLVAKMAAHLTESIYMPERTYSMLPKWLTDSRLSLGPDRPCLTISTKLNEHGDILDCNIQPGFIRNFVPITPHTLQQVVDAEAAAAEKDKADFSVIVGGQIPPITTRRMRQAHELSTDQVSDLKMLHKLALARQLRRTEAGGIFWNQNYPNMTVYNNYNRPGLRWSHPSRRIARFCEGDPVIMMEAQPTESWFQPSGTGTDLMVREMMLLAGEVGAKWCRERNVPIIYRGTIPRPGIMSMEEYTERVMKPSLDEHGNPPTKVAFNYLQHAGASITSTTPHKHQVLGVEQYAKLTSPLRRYGDMLLHWQIESTLRKEANLGHSIAGVGSTKADSLAFPRKEVEAIIARLAPRERLISKTKRASQAFWLTQLFFRAFYYGEAELPKTFEVVVFSTPMEYGDRVAVLWQDYSFDLDMLMPTDNCETKERPQIGDRWEVRITEVDAYNRRVLSEPIRLVSREEMPAGVADF